MKTMIFEVCVLATLSASFFAEDKATPLPVVAQSWSEKGAAAYLDGRLDWWIAWPSAARDHQTFCISCHTALPYAMARPALRSALAEQGPSQSERRLLDNVIKRVQMWKEVG